MKDRIVKYRVESSLVLLTLLMLAVMEWRHPYFFLQDDNRTLHLPYYVHNLKALLGGELPLFNFNQYLGTPVSFFSAPFYPVNYMAMLLSRLFLGHYFGTMEFIASIHLVCAATGFYRFCRGFEQEEFSCFFGAVAWAFSPFVITIGNSWIHVLGFAAWLPWILLFSLRQIRRFSIRDSLLLLFFRLLLILLGYPQWFLYTVLFELILLSALHVTSRIAGKEGAGVIAFRYAVNYLALFFLTLPFLVQLLRESGLSFARNRVLSWGEYALYSYRIKEWLNGLFAPFHNSGSHLFGELDFISHIGYLTLFFAFAALLSARQERFRHEILVFASLGLFSFLWSSDIVITKILYQVPFFNKLRYPFKLQFFTGFFLVTLAVFGFSFFSQWVREKFRGGAATLLLSVLFLHAINFLALYTLLPQRMLSNHLDSPPFTEPLKERLSGGRIVSAGPDVVWEGERVVPGHTVPTLGYNFAMLWGLYHFGGYEALLAEKNFNAAMGLVNNSIFNVESGKPLDFKADVPLNYLRNWGVKWYVVSSRIPLQGIEGLELVHRDQYRNVLYDPAGKPLVFWADSVETAPAYRFTANAVHIDTDRGGEGTLNVNLLYNPLFRGYLDGRAIAVTETGDGQVSLPVPQGSHKVVLRYVDHKFNTAAIISLIVLAAIIIYAYVAGSAGRRRKEAVSTDGEQV